MKESWVGGGGGGGGRTSFRSFSLPSAFQEGFLRANYSVSNDLSKDSSIYHRLDTCEYKAI